MTTFISKNEQQAVDIHNARSYKLENGSRIVICDNKSADEAVQFLEKSGLGGIYFDPAGDTEHYKDWGYVTENNFVVIELFNE